MSLTGSLTNNNLSANIGSNRRRLNDLPFELSFESRSDDEKFARSQDTEAVLKFNEDVKNWAEQTTSKLRISIRAKVVKDLVLSGSIRPKVYYDKKYAKEANRIGFSFNREGIYIEKGASRGHGGYMGGSKWYNRKGELKNTLSSSLMKMGTGNRPVMPWFNPVIEQRLPQLADLIAEYSATLELNATNIYIK